mmetsp:Transcript_1792/g.6704  ORF Transcript_1792/g.6704 Transcript_1792/m.6704 type:complete len:117 (-) Transcript_1792:1177-1527(-)
MALPEREGVKETTECGVLSCFCSNPGDLHRIPGSEKGSFTMLSGLLRSACRDLVLTSRSLNNYILKRCLTCRPAGRESDVQYEASLCDRDKYKLYTGLIDVGLFAEELGKALQTKT